MDIKVKVDYRDLGYGGTMVEGPYSRRVKRNVVQILRFYGFSAMEEVPAMIPEGGYGRVDVVGRKGSITIGVEIVDSGDVARDAKKLVMNGYTYKYIIVLNTSRRVNEISVDGEVVKVLDPDSFEHELRRDLRVPPTHPYFTEKQEPEQDVEFVDEASSTLKELKDELRDIGLETFADDILNAIREIYISREFCAGRFKPLPVGEYTIEGISLEVLSILQRLQLVSEHRRGTGYGRKMFLSLTERGEEIGRAAVTDIINEHKSELDRLVKDYAPEVWLVLRGSLRRYPKEPHIIYELRRVGFSEEEKSPLEILTSIRIDPYTTPYTSPSPTTLFAVFASKTILRNFAINFFKQLEKLGLAVRDYLYDSKGFAFSEVYKAPREVFDYFMARVSPPAQLAQCAQKLGAYYVIAEVSRIVDAPTARKRYNELLQTLEIPEVAIAEVLADMNRRGITSRLVERPDAAPFIVLNEKAFEKYLRERIEEVAKCF